MEPNSSFQAPALRNRAGEIGVAAIAITLAAAVLLGADRAVDLRYLRRRDRAFDAASHSYLSLHCCFFWRIDLGVCQMAEQEFRARRIDEWANAYGLTCFMTSR